MNSRCTAISAEETARLGRMSKGSGLRDEDVLGVEVLAEIIRRARAALASDGGLSRDASIAGARAAVERIRRRS